MISNKDKIILSIIEENLKLRNRIAQLVQEMEALQRNQVELLNDLVKWRQECSDILDIIKDTPMFRNANERGSSSKR